VGEVRIAVASPTLGAGFAGLLYSHLKKLLKPGQSLVEVGIANRYDPDWIRSRTLQLFEGDPPPVALIAICLRTDPVVLEALRAKGAPAILVDEEAEGASTVGFDSFAGGYLAGEHLAKLGRKHLAIVSGEMHINGGYNALQRVKGFQKALAERGLPFKIQDAIEVVEYSRKDGVTAMTRLLRERRKVDAIFSAAGDATASGLLATAREHGIQVPEELAILGYDDSPMASLTTPPLSTIRQSLERLAAEALRLATEARTECLARPKKVLFPPTLVLRGTA
jgi:DNA-binding LacI/PurR family transcriptional regulator